MKVGLLPIEQDRFNDHRRSERVGFEHGRKHRGQPVDGREPQPPVSRAASRAEGAFPGGKAVGRAISAAGHKTSRAFSEQVQGLLRHAHQAGHRTDPQTSLVVLDEVCHAVAHQPVALGVASPAAFGITSQAAAECADPKRAIGVGQQRGDFIARESVSLSKNGNLAVAQAFQSVPNRTDPQVALRVVRQCLHHVGRQAEGRRGRFPPLVVHSHQSDGGSEPEPAVAILVNRSHRRLKQRANLLEHPVLKPGQPAFPGSRPNIVAAVHEYASHVLSESLRADGEALELAVLPAADSVLVGSNPQCALVVLCDRLNDPAAALVDGVENLSLHAVEPAAVRADPERSLAVHEQRKHVVVGQPVAGGQRERIALRVEPEHPGAQGPNDQIALPIFAGRRNSEPRAPWIACEVLRAGVRRPLLYAPFCQPPMSTAPAGQKKIDIQIRVRLLRPRALAGHRRR